MKKLLSAVLTIMIIGSCSKKDTTPATPAPTVSFTYTKSSNTAPSNVQFTSTATNTTSYAWNFGDGTNSNVANPTHTYGSSGDYNVTVTVTGAGGTATASNTVSISAVVITPPTASFNYSGNGVAPSTVTFTNTSTNATSYSWDFGDNNNNTSTSQNATHTYLAGGTYTVSLTATNAGGSNTTTKTVNITAAYTKFVINKFTVTAFPAKKPNGDDWDILVLSAYKYPDLYFKISDSVSVVKFDNSATVIDNVQQSMLPQSWTPNPTYSQTSSFFNATRYFDLYDYDNGTDDYIGYVGFKMSDYMTLANPYPSTITATQNGITVKLDITWQP
jgi:PKD repeat protein